MLLLAVVFTQTCLFIWWFLNQSAIIRLTDLFTSLTYSVSPPPSPPPCFPSGDSSMLSPKLGLSFFGSNFVLSIVGIWMLESRRPRPAILVNDAHYALCVHHDITSIRVGNNNFFKLILNTSVSRSPAFHNNQRCDVLEFLRCLTM